MNFDDTEIKSNVKDSLNGLSGAFGPDIVETTDEDGQVHVFEKLDEVDIDDKTYALLVYKGKGDDAEADHTPHVHGEGCSHGHHHDDKEDADNDDEDGDEVVVMRVVHEDDGELYETIEDEDEFQKVVAYIESLNDADELALDDADDLDDEA